MPPYRQLVQQAERALLLGYLQRGDQLPRVKDVTPSLAVNADTVLKAYRELEYKGIAEGGVTETFGDTTSTTLLPMLVGQQDLGIANARAMTGLVVWNQLAGPPVGAALFAAGMALPFVSESVCVLAGVLLISRVRLPGHGAPRPRARVRDEIREGWSWLWGHAAVRTLAITIFTFNVTFGAAWSCGSGLCRPDIILALIWRSLLQIAHADEQTRASALGR